MTLTDQIREYVHDEIIAPARRQGLASVQVRAGDVHAALGLENRMPAVCGALDAEKFLEYAGVRLEERRGPAQGSSVEWKFILE